MRVTNITEEPIVLANYRLLNGLGAVERPELADDVQGTVDTWLTITRWFIGSAYASLPDGGRPALILQFEDVSNDTYERDTWRRTRCLI